MDIKIRGFFIDITRDFLEMIWEDQIEEIETTWEDISTYYRECLKDITHSEVDYQDKPIFYVDIKIPDTDVEIPGVGLDFTPLNFQSLFYVNSRKGWVN